MVLYLNIIKNIKHMKTTIKFETDKNIELFEGCNTIEDSIHEALCLAIHEGNEDALAWLQDNMINIE